MEGGCAVCCGIYVAIEWMNGAPMCGEFNKYVQQKDGHFHCLVRNINECKEHIAIELRNHRLSINDHLCGYP